GNTRFLGDLAHGGFVMIFFAFGVAFGQDPFESPTTVIPCDNGYLVCPSVFPDHHAAGGNFAYSWYLARACSRLGAYPGGLRIAASPSDRRRTGAPNIGWGAIGSTSGTVGHTIHSSP